jgi:hypothetical protein
VALTVSAFALTTLDTCTRLARFTLQEYFEDMPQPAAQVMAKNRYLSTTIVIILSVLLLASGEFEKLWPIFGSANQLLAALALLTIGVWLIKKNISATFVTIPMFFMFTVTLASLGLFAWKNFQDEGYILAVIASILFVLAIALTLARDYNARNAPAPALAVSPVAGQIELAATDVTPIQLMDINQGLKVTGVLKAVNSAIVKARVAGELQMLTVREGDTVTAGQVLAKIDPREFEARLQQAQQQADAALAQIDIAQRQFANNKALVDRPRLAAEEWAKFGAGVEALAAFALTEPGTGSDAASVKLTATPVDGGRAFSLSGEKMWISNGGIARVFTVFARTVTAAG